MANFAPWLEEPVTITHCMSTYLSLLSGWAASLVGLHSAEAVIGFDRVRIRINSCVRATFRKPLQKFGSVVIRRLHAAGRLQATSRGPGPKLHQLNTPLVHAGCDPARRPLHEALVWSRRPQSSRTTQQLITRSRGVSLSTTSLAVAVSTCFYVQMWCHPCITYRNAARIYDSDTVICNVRKNSVKITAWSGV